MSYYNGGFFKNPTLSKILFIKCATHLLKKNRMIPFWAELLLFFGVLAVLIVMTFLIVYFQPSQIVPSPTITPPVTVTFINPIVTQPVLITTLNSLNEVVCIGFNSLSQLEFGNCGSRDIQGTWEYNLTLKIAINQIAATTKSNCIINPPSIINPTVLGQVTSTSLQACNGVELNETTGYISGLTNDDSQVVRIGFIENSLAWVSDINHANKFTITNA
jgi:hypothetical protein